MKNVAITMPQSTYDKLVKLAKPEGNMSRTFAKLINSSKMKDLSVSTEKMKRTAFWLSEEDVAVLDKIALFNGLKSRNQAAAMIIEKANTPTTTQDTDTL